MGKNTSSIPDKNTGDSYAASEFETLRDFVDTPLQSLGAFDGSLLQIDGTGNYDDFTMSANLEITFVESGMQEGNTHIVEITADGTKTLTFTNPSAFTIINYTGLTNGATLASGTYIFSLFFIGGKIKIFKQTGSLIINSAPLLSSIAVASNNGSVVLTFNKGTYANNNGTGDLQVADFTPSLSGGTATNPVLSVPTHTAGDSTAGFTLSFTGEADGDEVLTITPADGSSVFEISGVAMDAGQTADDNLADKTAPTLTSATIENATDDVLDLVFDEAVTISITGWNIDTDGDALSISSILSGSGTSTPKIQLSRSVLGSETLNIDYDSGTGDTVDLAATPNELVSITDRAVTNNVTVSNLLLTNLISYWKMDESSDNRSDSHASNTLTDINTVTSATGKINLAASFAVSNSELLRGPTLGGLDFGDEDFTFSVWVKINTKGANRGIYAKSDSPNSQKSYFLTFHNGADTFRAFFASNADGSTFITIDSANFGSPSTGTFYHVVVYHDSVNNEIGIIVNDGTPDTAAFTTGVNQQTTDAFVIGMNGWSGVAGDNPFDGEIDEVGVWGKVLSSADITALYNSGSGLPYGSFT